MRATAGEGSRAGRKQRAAMVARERRGGGRTERRGGPKERGAEMNAGAHGDTPTGRRGHPAPPRWTPGGVGGGSGGGGGEDDRDGGRQDGGRGPRGAPSAPIPARVRTVHLLAARRPAGDGKGGGGGGRRRPALLRPRSAPRSPRSRRTDALLRRIMKAETRARASPSRGSRSGNNKWLSGSMTNRRSSRNVNKLPIRCRPKQPMSLPLPRHPPPRVLIGWPDNSNRSTAQEGMPCRNLATGICLGSWTFGMLVAACGCRRSGAA